MIVCIPKSKTKEPDDARTDIIPTFSVRVNDRGLKEDSLLNFTPNNKWPIYFNRMQLAENLYSIRADVTVFKPFEYHVSSFQIGLETSLY